MDSTITFTSGKRLWISAIAVMPSMPGIEMSVITTSGFTDSSNCSNSLPLRASAITCTPSTVESSALMPERTRSWSSARTTWMGRGEFVFFWIMVPSSFSQYRTDCHPATVAGADVQASAGEFCPFDHAVQADVSFTLVPIEHRRLVEADAVVGDQHADAPARQEAQPHPHRRSLRVPHHIRQRLLHQPHGDG